MTDDALLARLERLEGRNTALEAEVRALRAAPDRTPAPSPAPTVGRRQLLGKGLAAAGVAATGAVLLEGRPAAAANGQPLILGAQNGATTPTNLTGGLGLEATTGRALEIYSENSEGMQIQSADRAIGAFAIDGTDAIDAQATGADGIGVHGRGKVGVKAESFRSGGTGLDAIAGQNGTAVVGTAATGAGMRGRGSTYGVIGQSTTTDPDQAAVYASAIAGMAFGAATDTGQVMRASSGSGGGIEVDAPRFHLG